jgi:hypothetical protein
MGDLLVMPAQAGIQAGYAKAGSGEESAWAPAFAWVTVKP